MSKLLTLFAALTGLFVLSLAGPADAAQRKADGARNTDVGQYEVSDQRRYRRYHRRYYRPYRPYYYGNPYGYYPYGYYRPYYGYPRYYGPGFGFSFRF